MRKLPPFGPGPGGLSAAYRRKEGVWPSNEVWLFFVFTAVLNVIDQSLCKNRIFRKLKIKPPLYEDILAEIRKQQRSSFEWTTGRERAQKIAEHQKTPSSRGRINNRAPNSPSFSFTFTEHENHSISPYLLATAK